MRINEVENFYRTADRNVLCERIATHNDTGIKNEVLTTIVEQANNPTVWKEVTVIQLLEDLRSWGYKGDS